MRCLTLVFVFAIGGVCLADESPKSKAKSAIQWEKDIKSGSKRVKETQLPMFVLFTTPQCYYCDLMKSKTFSQDKVAKTIQNRFVPVEINGRKHRDITSMLKIKMYPTVAMIDTNGRLIDLVTGFKRPQELLKRITTAESKIASKGKAKNVR